MDIIKIEASRNPGLNDPPLFWAPFAGLFIATAYVLLRHKA